MKFFQAVFILSGMIIGAGIFGVPFAFARAGFIVGAIELFFVAGMVTAVHLLYAEVVLRTKAPHRLPGYAAFYLGRFPSYVARGSACFGISGTLLIYILLGSHFLSVLSENLLPFLGQPEWAVIFVGVCALVTFFPLRRETFINSVLTALLVIFFILLIVRIAPFVDTARLSGFYPREALFPYGILLFALSGALVIPDLITFLGRNRVKVRGAIIAGSLIPAIITFLFAWAVVGVSGLGTTEDALAGIEATAGSSVIILGSIIGFLAVFTSYTMLTSSFESLLHLDFRIHSRAAWLTALGIPFMTYLLGFTDFIRVVAVVGAIAVGVDNGVILAVHERMRRRTRRRFSLLFLGKVFIYGMIVLGIAYEIIKVIFGD